MSSAVSARRTQVQLRQRLARRAGRGRRGVPATPARLATGSPPPRRRRRGRAARRCRRSPARAEHLGTRPACHPQPRTMLVMKVRSCSRASDSNAVTNIAAWLSPTSSTRGPSPVTRTHASRSSGRARRAGVRYVGQCGRPGRVRPARGRPPRPPARRRQTGRRPRGWPRPGARSSAASAAAPASPRARSRRARPPPRASGTGRAALGAADRPLEHLVGQRRQPGGDRARRRPASTRGPTSKSCRTTRMTGQCHR